MGSSSARSLPRPRKHRSRPERVLPPHVYPRTILCTNVLSCGGLAGSEGAASKRGGTLGRAPELLNYTPVAGNRT